MDKAGVLEQVMQLLISGDTQGAAAAIENEYPHAPVQSAGRRWTQKLATRLYIRDGFIDRYTGQRLVFPGALKTLSLTMPEVFPAHKNWKMTETHIAYWELYPSIDHIIPVARGGLDEESNWVTTSMKTNQIKSNWTLDELGWELHPPGRIEEWDGLLGLFMQLTESDPGLLQDTYVRNWHRAAVALY